jgi:hypothetical protein
MKSIADEVVPPELAIVMGPVTAALGTGNVSSVVLTTLPVSAGTVTPPRVTAVMLVENPVPVTVTVVPTTPEEGVKLVMVGVVTVLDPAPQLSTNIAVKQDRAARHERRRILMADQPGDQGAVLGEGAGHEQGSAPPRARHAHEGLDIPCCQSDRLLRQHSLGTDHEVISRAIRHEGEGHKGPRPVGADVDCRDRPLEIHLLGGVIGNPRRLAPALGWWAPDPRNLGKQHPAHKQACKKQYKMFHRAPPRYQDEAEPA